MNATRRDFLSAALGSGAAALAAGTTRGDEPPRRGLRIAHLTDIHVQPEREAARGLEACLAHVQSARDRGEDAPDLIVTGGDTVMDCMEADLARTNVQWDLWRKAKADHCSLEVRSVVGNHDVWGWTKARAGTTGTEPLYGKQLACEQFGRPLPYESFDSGGWHVVLLDSTFPHEQSYIGKLDDAQWDWLEKDLAAVPATTPVVVFSHIPILTVHALAATRPAPNAAGRPDVPVSGQLLHTDHQRLVKLFSRHRNVKACVSGHLHVVEQIDYGGVRYLCNGAVSAGWWRGPHAGTDFGYALVDLGADGTVSSRYVPYGWTVRG